VVANQERIVDKRFSNDGALPAMQIKTVYYAYITIALEDNTRIMFHKMYRDGTRRVTIALGGCYWYE
jgi:hypothetical protein